MGQTPKLTERRIQDALYQRHRGSALSILPNYTPTGWAECDLFVILPSGFTIEYEIKLTRADFNADKNKRWKHRTLGGEYPSRWRPTRFFYVAPADLIARSEVPIYAGLLYVETEQARLSVRVVCDAPRTSNQKMDDKMLQQMWKNSYYRLWAERSRLDQYQRDVGFIRDQSDSLP